MFLGTRNQALATVKNIHHAQYTSSYLHPTYTIYNIHHSKRAYTLGSLISAADPFQDHHHHYPRILKSTQALHYCHYSCQDHIRTMAHFTSPLASSGPMTKSYSSLACNFQYVLRCGEAHNLLLESSSVSALQPHMTRNGFQSGDPLRHRLCITDDGICTG